MQVVGLLEWFVGIVQAIYNDPKSRNRANGSYSDEFEVKVDVDQGYVMIAVP